MAEAIRGVVLNPEHKVTAIAELLLFVAARAQVTAGIIRPQMESGKIVLCDRYIDSTAAYQGHARGNELETVRRLNALVTGGLVPDVTILLDLDPEQGLQRQRNHNRMEAESISFHRAVREGFLKEARIDPRRIRVVDATRSVEAVHAEILGVITLLLAEMSITE